MPTPFDDPRAAEFDVEFWILHIPTVDYVSLPPWILCGGVGWHAGQVHNGNRTTGGRFAVHAWPGPVRERSLRTIRRVSRECQAPRQNPGQQESNPKV